MTTNDDAPKGGFWLQPQFEFGETVYLRVGTDESLRGLVTCISVYADGQIIYRVAWGDRKDTDHYALELSRTPVYATTED